MIYNFHFLHINKSTCANLFYHPSSNSCALDVKDNEQCSGQVDDDDDDDTDSAIGWNLLLRIITDFIIGRFIVCAKVLSIII